MTQYWLIKGILLIGFIGIAWFLMRPVHSPGHLALRRLSTMLVIAFAVFAVLFPGLLNKVAYQLGVERGINLLVYVIVLAFFAQMANTYRRDSSQERRMTGLARAIALDSVRSPIDEGDAHSGEDRGPATAHPPSESAPEDDATREVEDDNPGANAR